MAKEKADILEVKKAELDLAKKELLAKETALAQAQGKTAQLTVEKEAAKKAVAEKQAKALKAKQA